MESIEAQEITAIDAVDDNDADEVVETVLLGWIEEARSRVKASKKGKKEFRTSMNVHLSESQLEAIRKAS